MPTSYVLPGRRVFSGDVWSTSEVISTAAGLPPTYLWSLPVYLLRIDAVKRVPPVSTWPSYVPWWGVFIDEGSTCGSTGFRICAMLAYGDVAVSDSYLTSSTAPRWTQVARFFWHFSLCRCEFYANRLMRTFGVGRLIYLVYPMCLLGSSLRVLYWLQRREALQIGIRAMTSEYDISLKQQIS